MEVQLRRRENIDDYGCNDQVERLTMMEASSPEAKLGKRVEDLWDNLEPQLSPTDKLNACFESIPVSSFPLAQASQGFFFSLSFLFLLSVVRSRFF